MAKKKAAKKSKAKKSPAKRKVARKPAKRKAAKRVRKASAAHKKGWKAFGKTSSTVAHLDGVYKAAKRAYHVAGTALAKAKGTK